MDRAFLARPADGGDPPFGTIAWGQQHIESGLAGILFGTMPIMSVVLAPLFLAEETFTRRRLAGALVGLAGRVLVQISAVQFFLYNVNQWFVHISCHLMNPPLPIVPAPSSLNTRQCLCCHSPPQLSNRSSVPV